MNIVITVVGGTILTILAIFGVLLFMLLRDESKEFKRHNAALDGYPPSE